LTIEKSEFIKIGDKLAKVLNVPYFNQVTDTNMNPGTNLGGYMCGAASTTMVAGYYGWLKYSDSNSLREYMYQDKGVDLSVIPGYKRICGGGTFSVTSADSGCSWGSDNRYVMNYLRHFGADYTRNWGYNFNHIKRDR